VVATLTVATGLSHIDLTESFIYTSTGPYAVATSLHVGLCGVDQATGVCVLKSTRPLLLSYSLVYPSVVGTKQGGRQAVASWSRRHSISSGRSVHARLVQLYQLVSAPGTALQQPVTAGRFLFPVDGSQVSCAAMCGETAHRVKQTTLLIFRVSPSSNAIAAMTKCSVLAWTCYAIGLLSPLRHRFQKHELAAALHQPIVGAIVTGHQSERGIARRLCPSRTQGVMEELGSHL
jgi:hypothetical protein